MSERSDDTPERPEAGRDERGSYYYDDATGYEVYNPSDEEQEEPLKKDVDREESCQPSALNHQPSAHGGSLA